MRHPLRVAGEQVRADGELHGDSGVDVLVDAAPGATVGELADELAALGGQPLGQSVASRWPLDRRADPPDRSELLETHGPPAGATVVLVDPPAVAATAPPSPVRLVAEDEELALGYGATKVGDVVVEVAEAVTVRAAGASTARVGGRPLLGSARLAHGSLLRTGATLWTVHVGAELQPPRTGGWSRPHQGRRDHAAAHEPVTVRLPTPPAAIRLPGFPVLSATVPLCMGVALWIATGSLLAAGFMLFSVVFVVASGLESRREARAEDRARVLEFRHELDDTLAELDHLADEQRRRHGTQGWSPGELHDLLTAQPAVDPAVWHRSSSPARPPSWTVRLGPACVPAEDRVIVPDQGRRALRAELRRIADQRATVDDDIATLDLADHGGLLIEAAGERAVAIARAVVMQLVTAIGPDHLRIQVVAPAERASTWSALDWLPHASSRCGRRLLVVDGDPPVAPEPDEAGTDASGDAAPLLLWVRTPGTIRPPGVRAALVAHDREVTLERIDSSGLHVTRISEPEPLEHDECEPLARRLAALAPVPATAWGVDGTRDDRRGEGLPAHVSLSEVAASAELISDPEAVVSQWRRSTAPGPDGSGPLGLATPIGHDGRGGVVNIDLGRDGPHALVAGTTGAGKSELLRTFLVSAALHHPPDRLQLLLIDYKGGAAFGPLTELPHTAGTITDLSGALAPRALSSLRAELRRREQLVAATGGATWSGPALLVVVDELATLVAEQPEFVDGLVDLAQRGRSLGVHLVLATQRPAGVITDAIRANVTVRIALRVADQDDSRDVVDTPAAAHLPRHHPGRAVVRVGPGLTTMLQTAYCAAPAAPRPPVRVQLRARPAEHDRAAPTSCASDEPAPSELETSVTTVVAAARRIGAAAAHRPWLDPLPDRVGSDTLPRSDTRGVLPLGLVDRPDLQDRTLLRLDLGRDGGATIVGASGSGRSTFVRTVADAAARSAAERWQLYVIDAGGDLADLAGSGVVGDVIDVHDAERVLRLLRRADRELTARRGQDPAAAPRLLVVIDGIAAFDERYERLDRGIAVDLLARIARDGRSVGVHLLVTAHRRADVPVGLAGLLPARVVLRCATTDDAALLGLDDTAADPDLVPGRCHIGRHLAQVAVPGDEAPGSSDAAFDASAPHDGAALRCGAPPPVPRLPTQLSIAHLTTPTSSPWQLVVGLDADTLEPAVLDLAHHHGLVAGPPRSGVSTVLAAIAAAHGSSRVLTRADADELPDVVERALSETAAGAERLLLLDDLHELLDHADPSVAGAVERLLTAGRDRPLRVVAGGEVDALSRCYHEAMAVLKAGRTGILLGDDADLHASMWHASPPPRTDLPPAPGRGWLLSPGVARPVQVATAG